MTTSTAPKARPTQLGWRFAIGVVLIVGGYAAWSLIPFAVMTDLHPAVKSVLTGLLGASMNPIHTQPATEVYTN